MDQFIIDQIAMSLRAIPYHLARSFFIPGENEETRAFREKVGYICGVCHPHEEYDLLKEANIEWVRFDIPFPFERDGSVSPSYEDFKKRCKGYRDRDIKVMAVSPFPKHFTDAGMDTRGNDANLKKVAEFMIEDLQGYVNGIQITNESGIPHFTIPYTVAECAEFIGKTAMYMYPKRGDIVIGYNSGGPQADLHVRMKPWFRYMDYVGFDLYMGCFMNMPGFLWVFDAIARYLWSLSGKPILLEEFGYISDGAPKTKDQKKIILQKYGVSSEKEAYRDIVHFIDKLPRDFQHMIRFTQPDEAKQGDRIFKSDLINHLYCELPRLTKIPGFPHTQEGQAKFFKVMIPRLYEKKFMAGSIVYCWADSDKCYYCGQEECPTETRWGLVDRFAKPKASFYAVRDAFGFIRENR